MKIKYTSHTKKNIIIGLICLIVLIGVGAYALINTRKPTNTPITNEKTSSDSSKKVNDINTGKPTDAQIQAGNDTKKAAADSASSTAPSPSTTPLSVTITSKVPPVQQNDSLIIKTLINTLSNTGTCELTLSQGTKTIVEPAVGIQALADTSTCKGFTIPGNQLSSGVWNISIKVTIGSQISTTSDTVTVS